MRRQLATPKRFRDNGRVQGLDPGQAAAGLAAAGCALVYEGVPCSLCCSALLYGVVLCAAALAVWPHAAPCRVAMVGSWHEKAVWSLRMHAALLVITVIMCVFEACWPAPCKVLPAASCCTDACATSGLSHSCQAGSGATQHHHFVVFFV